MELELTAMAALAARFVNNTQRHVFLTGNAGTGKTTFLHQVVAGTHKRLVVLAPTGVAALNAKGVTLHSQFLLPFGSFLPTRRAPPELGGRFVDRDTLARSHPLIGMRRAVLREVDLLVIDEVSMLRADLLDAVDFRLREVKRNYDTPFGGAQVLFIGDLHQLPPVVKDDEWQVLREHYATPHFFSAHALRADAGTRPYVHIELDKIFRQSDPRFITLLNHFRNNTVGPQDIQELNKHYRPDASADEQGVITLTTHNHKADAINNAALAKLPGASRVFTAKVAGDFPESMYPLPTRLELRIGAQIMFTRNDAEREYYNGKLGRVTRIADDGVAIEMADDKSHYLLTPTTWDNKRYAVQADNNELVEEVIGQFTHYPIKLAWAITVHKSQGLTFDKAIIDVGSAFASGQVYVALSRLRSLDGLILRTRIGGNRVATDRDVVNFSARKDDQALLPTRLQDEQRAFVLATLAATFSFAALLSTAEHIADRHRQSSFGDATLNQSLADFIAMLRNEQDNTRKFRSQLQRITSQGDQPLLLTRIGKGTEYYTTLLSTYVCTFLKSRTAIEKIDGAVELREDLSELDAALMRKLTEIGKAGNMADSILSGRQISREPPLDSRLREARQAILAAANASSHAPRPPGKRPRKRKKRKGT
jgi:hypothetical protein